MMKSWIKRVIALLAAMTVTLTVFMLWTNLNYNNQIRNTAMRENTNTASSWGGTVTTQLNALHEHIYDLMLLIYNSTQQLVEGTPMMRFEAQTKVLDAMSDKLIVNSNASCFFVRDNSTGLFLFSFKSGIPNRESSALKSFARLDSGDHAGTLNDKTWRIETVDGKAYFIQTVSLGKYTVGGMSRLSSYDIRDSFSVLGEQMSCMILQDGTAYLCSGEDWTEDLRLQDEEVRFSDNRSAVVVPFDTAKAQIVLAVRTSTLLQDTGTTAEVLLLLSSVVCLLLMIYLFLFLNFQVLRPTRALLRANQSLASGSIDYRITDAPRSTEFSELYDSFNSMADQIKNLRIASYDLKLREQDNRLRMLRAQIKPHFYLNAITTITNMTYQGKPENIRTYIASLARYLRYMMNTQSEWTTVEDELTHIRNYLQMQELRFPDSIRAEIVCTPEAAQARIPMLALFTLVENSLKHAMTLYEPLKIRITAEPFTAPDFAGVRLVEEDSGEGFPAEVLESMSRDEIPVLTKEHLGLSNLRYTLNLTYQRDDLLHVSNRDGGGAHVEIWIPEGTEHESSYLR